MAFTHDRTTYNRNAAQEILPFILCIQNIKSILDVGCGLGTWLVVAKDLGVKDITGVDGEWVKPELLEIESDDFIKHNLSEPFDLHKEYDLVVSLEVAEHIDEKYSDIFIESLVRHSKFILFSAAIENQGGQNHINEQNPSYWANKFNKYNYLFYDVLRERFWDNKNVEYWYKQNIFLVAEKGILDDKFKHVEQPLTLVHPELLYVYQQPSNNLLAKHLNINKSEAQYILNCKNKIKLLWFFAKKLFLTKLIHAIRN